MDNNPTDQPLHPIMINDPYPDIQNSNNKRKNENFAILLLNFFKIYWRSFVLILTPLVCLPIVLIDSKENELALRCLYVIVVMALFWMTEVLPLPITGLIPVGLFPLMGIMDTSNTSICYMNDTTMMFLGSLVIAVVIENSGLHLRLALLFIKSIGCSHRRLTFGLFYVTMFISMWISNTAATVMMVSIVETVLVELEVQGLGNRFVDETTESESCGGDNSIKRPTKITMVYYLIASYASTIGGIGTLVGTGTNLTLKGLFEKHFPNSPGLSFSSWMVYNVPVILLMGFLVWLWLQIMYMGLFRVNSEDARACNIGKEGEKIATSVIENKYKELGPISWHESLVAFLFSIIVLLWFFRSPGFVRGWPTYITDLRVQDSTAATLMIILFFVLPSKLDFLRAFDKDSTRRPTKESPALITWKMINQKMHWSLLLVLGGGFAIAAGSRKSGLSSLLSEELIGLKSMSPWTLMLLVCLFAQTFTELTANVVVASIILPVLANMSVAMELNPLYLMLPATLCCSFSFHLPVGTPPNAIVSAAGHIKTKDFIIAGIGPSIITMIVIGITFPTWGSYVFDLYQFPEWARNAST